MEDIRGYQEDIRGYLEEILAKRKSGVQNGGYQKKIRGYLEVIRENLEEILAKSKSGVQNLGSGLHLGQKRHNKCKYVHFNY